ncbi:MFS transporter [Microbacterium resistens]|uniref:MFS transporter n=1 Tax=Microbacterium TaxID=33882 RepID=UPI001C59A04A|nr:MFS transporter [Microbacterium resistens]MBW1637516.1 MFS transporter [Microbacterium resistens]
MKPVTSGSGANRAGVRLLATASISRLAHDATGIAVILGVLDRTGDAGLAGLVAAAFTFPAIVTGTIVGAQIDRARSRRRLFLAAHALLTGSLVGVLLLAGHVPGPLLILLGLAAGVTAPVLTGGFSAVLPGVIAPTAWARANAADAASYNLAGIAGPVLVAAVAGLAGAGAALAAIAALSAIGLTLMIRVPLGTATKHGRESLAASIADGLRLLWSNKLLRTTTAATTINQLGQGLLPVALLLFARQLGHDPANGAWLLSVFGAGALGGALLSERLLRRWQPLTVMTFAVLTEIICFAALSASPTLLIALLIVALAGLGDGPLLAATFGVRQSSVPSHRYAQVVASAASLKTGAYALGTAIAGLLAAVCDARQLVLLAAGVNASALVVLCVSPRHQSAQPSD